VCVRLNYYTQSGKIEQGRSKSGKSQSKITQIHIKEL